MPLSVLHITLAIQLLLSSTGVAVFGHLCRIKGNTTALFQLPAGCCKAASACSNTTSYDDCHRDVPKVPTPRYEKQPCCQDIYQLFKTDIRSAVLKSNSGTEQKNSDAFDAFPWNTTSVHLLLVNSKKDRFYLYKPPPIASDIRVLLQSFLC